MKIKISPDELKPGMYVSELDRPWIESPFLFQGFDIKDYEEIDQLRQLCSYVYIDFEKTPVSIRPDLLAAKPNNNKGQFIETTTFELQKSDKELEADFIESAKITKKTRDKTRQYIDAVLNDVRLGASVDTGQAKMLVSDIVNSIVSHPDASLWLTQLKSRDEYTAIHSVNVCVLSISFGRALGLSNEDLNVLGLGALLHDIGKMKVPLEVLNKPGKLTDEEFDIMKSHPEEGYKLLKDDPSIPPAALEAVLSHHERLNAKGYPNRKSDDEISYFTRIVSIVDVYDAVTSDRVYHDGMTPHEALKNLYNWMPNNFDQGLVEFFIKTIGIYPVGCIVEFKSGHIGMVVKVNEKNKLKPLVMLILNRKKQPYPQRKIINMASPIWVKQKQSIEIRRIVEAKEYGINVNQILMEETQSFNL